MSFAGDVGVSRTSISKLREVTANYENAVLKNKQWVNVRSCTTLDAGTHTPQTPRQPGRHGQRTSARVLKSQVRPSVIAPVFWAMSTTDWTPWMVYQWQGGQPPADTQEWIYVVSCSQEHLPAEFQDPATSGVHQQRLTPPNSCGEVRPMVSGAGHLPDPQSAVSCWRVTGDNTPGSAVPVGQRLSGCFRSHQ